MWALRFNATNAVRTILEAGPDVNLRDKGYNTALMYCGKLGDYGVTVASNLLALGACVNATNSGGETAMANAVRSSNQPLIRYLVSQGAKVEIVNVRSQTIVMLAASHSDDETLQLVCNLAPALRDARDQVGNGAVTYALFDTSRFLGNSKPFQRKLEVLVSHGYDVNVTNRSGITPLIYASQSCDVETVKALLLRGADSNVRDSTGKTALEWAVTKQCDEVVEYLRENGGAIVEVGP